MRFERITTIEHNLYEKALELYCESFPAHEQRNAASQAKILRDEEYHFNLIYDDDIFVGLLLCWETADFIYVEHFCISSEMRNQKYGQKALDLLCQQEKTVILEIDPPNETIAIRRKEFYERNGFVENIYSHIHPPYDTGNKGHQLMVMSYPNKISPIEYDAFKSYLDHRVMKELFEMSECLTFKTRKEFRNWLIENSLSNTGIWLLFDKSGKQAALKASEALEEALCFGWIDGQMKRIDEHRYQKYFSLRRKNSKWSEKNKALVIELENKGIMTDLGLSKIQEAKENGQWEVNNTIVIKDTDIELLAKELEGIEPAYSNYLAMSPSVKKTYTKAYQAPKTAAGKEKRLLWIIDRLNKNLKPM